MYNNALYNTFWCMPTIVIVQILVNYFNVIRLITCIIGTRPNGYYDFR